MEELLTLDQVAEMAGISPATVYRRIAVGRLPEPVRTGGVVRWRKEEVVRELDLEDGLLGTRDAAAWLQVSRGTIRAMVVDGRLPEPERRGNADFWRKEDLAALVAHPEQRTADAGTDLSSYIYLLDPDCRVCGRPFTRDAEGKAAHDRQVAVIENETMKAPEAGECAQCGRPRRPIEAPLPQVATDSGDIQRDLVVTEVVRGTRFLIRVDVRLGLETVMAIGATSYLLETALALRREPDPELAAEAAAAIRALREPPATDETPFDRPALAPQQGAANVEAVIAGPSGSTDSGGDVDIAAKRQELPRRGLELATEWAEGPPSVVDHEPPDPDEMPSWSVIEAERAERMLNEGRGVYIDLAMFEDADGGLWMNSRKGLDYIRIMGKHQFLRAVEELLDRSGIPDGPAGGLPEPFNQASGGVESQPDSRGGVAAQC